MSLRPIGMLALSLVSVCLAMPQASQQPPIKIPKLPKQTDNILTIKSAGSSDWRPSSLNPKALLERGDTWMAQLKNASGETNFVWATSPDGTWGVLRGQVAVVNARKFKASYGHFYHQDGEIFMHAGSVTADGSHWQTYDQEGFAPAMPVSTPRLPKSVLANWPQQAQDLIFTEWAAKEHTLSKLYQAATAAGMRATAEQRTYTLNGVTARQNRVLLKGTPTINGKKAHFEVEILLDAPTGALLKLTQYRQFGNDVKTRFRSFWAVKWDRTPGQTFAPSIFAIAQATPRSSTLTQALGFTGRPGSR